MIPPASCGRRTEPANPSDERSESYWGGICGADLRGRSPIGVELKRFTELSEGRTKIVKSF